MFDLSTVKEAAEAAGMAKPGSGQVYYIDLSEGDSAVVYQQKEANILSRLLTSLNHGSTRWWNISTDGRIIMRVRRGVRRGAFLLLALVFKTSGPGGPGGDRP